MIMPFFYWSSLDRFHFQSESEFGIVNHWLSRTHRLTFDEQENHLSIRPHTQQSPAGRINFLLLFYFDLSASILFS